MCVVVIRGILILILFGGWLPTHATGDSLHYLTPKDTIFISLDHQGDKIFEHTLAPKQTLYSLAKFYGLTLNDLYLYNPGLRQSTNTPGQAIRIPIPNRAILRFKPDDFVASEFIPVCYVVRKGDTMYRIAKRYFRMPMDTIRDRNGLPDYQIKTGQALQVGWMSIKGIPDSLRLIRGGPLWERSHTLGLQFQSNSEGKSPREERGVATWERDRISQGAELFVLHRYAPLNSVAAITNPMSRTTIYVQVIGRVPPFHDPNVIAVVTPTVAEMLGAIDPRFFVHTRFYEE